MSESQTQASGPPTEAEEESPVSSRDLLVFRAQLCEQSNRFEDMVDIMQDICLNHDDLTIVERNLLSCAYKNVIGSRRTSWKVLNEALRISKTFAGGDQTRRPAGEYFNPQLIQTLIDMIEAELRGHCTSIINILDNRLIPSPMATGESRVFYFKMKGDYLRYLCEICSEAERKDKANESLLAYKTASEKATIELPPTHPVRLGLMLNFSVFYYEIMKSPERSCRLAKQAFDDAIAELDTLSEESYRDSTFIMTLLRDNLYLWESEQNVPSQQNSTTNDPIG